MKFLFLRKQSMVYLILISFWLGYVAWSFGFTIHNINNTTKKHFEFRKDRLEFTINLALPYLVNDQTFTLVDYLKVANEKQLLDFYLLTKQIPQKNLDGFKKSSNRAVANSITEREVVAFAAPQDNLEGINWNYPVEKSASGQLENLYEDNDVFYKTVQIDDYFLTLGLRKKLNDLVYHQAVQSKNAFLQDMAVVTLMLTLIVIMFTRDILNLTNSLKKKEDLLKKGFSSLTAEGQVLLAATKTFAVNEKDLKTTNKHYLDVIAPALIEEINLKTIPKTVLSTTLVRIDLNGYTQLFLDRKETNITEILNTYFQRAREVIERYHGLVYQIIGDEIVFHIKDSKNYDSQVMALFCLRNLFEVTNEIEEKYFKTAAVDLKSNSLFKIKASLVHGSLKFIKLDDGYAFSGLPLIESVRMIGAFEEKKTNSITCTKSMADKYFSLIEIDTTTEKQFKGFDAKTEVCLIKNFRTEGQILHCFDKAQFAKYARKDTDIIKTIHHLETYVRQSDLKHFYDVVNEIKNYKLFYTTDEVTLAYCDLIEFAMDEFEQNPTKKEYLSSLISLSYNLVPAKQFNSNIKRVFNHCLKIGDPRTQANVVTALEEFDPQSEIYKDYFDSASNRLAANALLVEAKKEINKKVKSQIMAFIKSDNLFFVASGLWVVEQSVLFHQQNNSVYFNSNSYFTDLLDATKKFASHDNEMVRRRALAVMACCSPSTDHQQKAA